MDRPLLTDRAVLLQLGAVGVIAGVAVCSGGILGPFGAALLGSGAAQLAGESLKNVIPNILSGLFDKLTGRMQEQADKTARQRQNHHIQRGINLAVAGCLDKALLAYGQSLNRPPYLTQIRAALRKNPLRFAIANQAAAIDEARISALLTGPIETVRDRKPLEADQWRALLAAIAAELQCADRAGDYYDGVKSLYERFTIELIESFKELGVENDPAWFALVIRFLSEIHAATRDNGAALAALQQLVTDHATAMNQAMEQLHQSIHQRCGTGDPTLIAADRAQLAFIHEQATALATDLPAIAGALGRIEATLAFVVGKLDTIERAATRAAGNTDQILATLQSQGVSLILEDHAPPRPTKYVPRPALMQKLMDTLWGDGRASVTGRAAAQGDGGQGKSVLSLAYAQESGNKYPGGRYRVVVENQTLEAALAAMIPAVPALQNMPQPDKARLACAILSREPKCLLIIDNVDDATVWNDPGFQNLIPCGACHVIVTSREERLANIAPVPVGRLEDAEARAVLASFRSSASEPAHAGAVGRIIRAVEGLAVAVASVGAMMSLDESDKWADYAARLEAIPLDDFADRHADVRTHTGYSGRILAALDDLFRRLPTPAQRIMEYAALLPEDLIPAADHVNGNPPEVRTSDWLVALLAADAAPARGAERIALGTQRSGTPNEPRDFVRKLQSLGLLTPANPERTLWTLHRLHAKRCRERM